MKPRLRQVQQLINSEIGIVLRCSHVYKSKAWGFTSEGEFMNQAMLVDTDLPPEELLTALQGIEDRLGRDRKAEAAEKERTGQAYSSRVIDIDILFYNDMEVNLPDLTIPHPLLQDRDFVLAPLYEIVPNKVHPTLHKTIGDLRTELLARNDGKNSAAAV